MSAHSRCECTLVNQCRQRTEIWSGELGKGMQDCPSVRLWTLTTYLWRPGRWSISVEALEALMWKWLYNLIPVGSPGLGKLPLGAWAEVVLSISPSEHDVASLISFFGLTCVPGHYFKWIGQKYETQRAVPLEQAGTSIRPGPHPAVWWDIEQVSNVSWIYEYVHESLVKTKEGE